MAALGLHCCLLAFSGCSEQGLLLSHGARASRCRAQALGRAGSVAVAHGLSCSASHEIFSDQGSNPCLLHWQVGSLPLSHQRSPILLFFKIYFIVVDLQ